MGARGGSAARKFFTVGKPSVRARHRQKAGYFAYSALASGERKRQEGNLSRVPTRAP